MSAGPKDVERDVRGRLSPRAALLCGLGVFVVLFALYRATVMPTVIDQDSGELVAACHVLGIAHPTGYPLWVLLGRGFDVLPLGGTSAYRVALLSVVTTAGAAGLLTLLAAGLVGEVVPAVAAGLAFGLWYPTWSQAVRAEVYGLTALLAALALAALVKWQQARSARELGWLALACGFVSMHHRTAMLAVAPALVVAAVLTRPRQARTYLRATGLFLAPFLFYAYLPIAAAARPPVNWTDPVTWDRFWQHVLASQYQGYAFSHSAQEMLEVAGWLVPELLVPSAGWSAALGVMGAALIGWGWWRWVRREPVAAWALAAGASLLVFWVLQWGEMSDLKVFFPPAGEVFALCGAMGLAGLLQWFGRRRVARPATAGVAAFLCAVLLVGNWGRADLSNLWQHRDRRAAVLHMLEPNAVFVSDTDSSSFGIMYLQHVEGLREDVTLVRMGPLEFDWYIGTLPDPVLREAGPQAWEEAKASLAAMGPMNPFRWKWERTALFAHNLARRLRGRRPVYASHGPESVVLSGPPYFVGISEDVVALRFERPTLTEERTVDSVVAEYLGGIELLEFEWERTQVATGEMVGFRTAWRVKQKLPEAMQFAVGLAPQSVGPDYFAERLREKGRFVQAFPLMEGQWRRTPTPTGEVYVQRGQVVVPTNCPAGSSRVAVGVSRMYHTEELSGWTELGRLEVAARPRPKNGP